MHDIDLILPFTFRGTAVKKAVVSAQTDCYITLQGNLRYGCGNAILHGQTGTAADGEHYWSIRGTATCRVQADGYGKCIMRNPQDEDTRH